MEDNKVRMLLKIETIVLLDDKIRHIYMSQDDLLK
jgi:hypothetical protein